LLSADDYPDYDGFAIYEPADATTTAILAGAAAAMAGL